MPPTKTTLLDSSLPSCFLPETDLQMTLASCYVVDDTAVFVMCRHRAGPRTGCDVTELYT